MAKTDDKPTVKASLCECGSCRQCKKRAYQRIWRERNRDRERATNRARYWTDPEKGRARARDWRNENREVVIPRERASKARRRDDIAVADRARRERMPEKFKARTAVNNAIQSGRLAKAPCEGCGATDVQAHHDDYSKPLDVRWLCPPCHGLVHRKAAA